MRGKRTAREANRRAGENRATLPFTAPRLGEHLTEPEKQRLGGEAVRGAPQDLAESGAFSFTPVSETLVLEREKGVVGKYRLTHSSVSRSQ
jgi:hypothetical protein